MVVKGIVDYARIEVPYFPLDMALFLCLKVGRRRHAKIGKVPIQMELLSPRFPEAYTSRVPGDARCGVSDRLWSVEDLVALWKAA